MCVDLKDGVQANGTPLQIWDCDRKNPNQLWRKDANQMRLFANPNLCIDAGVNPTDGSRVKVWQCYPGLPQQTWVTSGPKKQLKGTNLCLDVTNGNWVNGQQLQVWTCNFGNVNQVFFEAPAAEYIRTNQS
ncbi:hypothetical protein VHUM_01828 [Vanrija humicola]|uniref:Ricin B lectin domain-containing protein n=1 Tax=Vanrija humicola TaxID=5417 RepID=A0A7D8Z1N4_VANHU|nr:hypothetical protein VHUM_01828 [Vanrija humicola]